MKVFTILMGFLAVTIAGSAADAKEPLDLTPFLQTGTSSSAVATAVSALEAWGCTAPLRFEQEPGREEDEIVLSVVCDEQTDAYAMLIFFIRDQNGDLYFKEMYSIP